MKIMSKIFVIVIAMAFIGYVIPTDVASEFGPQETDVAIVREYWYILENSEISSGGSSMLAPTYHNLFVTSDSTGVTFHNYAEIHDERIQTTVYYLEWSIIVFEDINGELDYIDSSVTGSTQYSPPWEELHPQTISIDVNFNGMGTHLYYVTTGYEWYEVQSDGSREWIAYNEYAESAYVHEVEELPGNGGESNL